MITNMESKQNLHRIQILLEKEQEHYLDKVSKKTGKSVSALIRALVSEKMSGARERMLARVASELRAAYSTDQELTAFSSLDAEDWDA
jgi:predicted DNA-binding protein